MTALPRLKVLLNHLNQNQPEIRRTTITTHYEFTKDNSLLSKEQRDFYETNGYLVFKKMIEPELLEKFKERFIDYAEGRVKNDMVFILRDRGALKAGLQGEHLVNRISFFVNDEVLEKYILHEKLLKYIECFTGPNIVAFHTMLINKPPDTGSGTSQHPLHQDAPYFSFRPFNTTVAAWTAMENITPENGGLFVSPGTHKLPVLPHTLPETDVNVLFYGVKGFENVRRVELRMEKGDTVFFSPLLLHGSGPNFSNRFRKAISCHFVAAETYFIDVSGSVQEKLCKEVEKLINKKRQTSVSYTQNLRATSRLVRGKNVNYFGF